MKSEPTIEYRGIAIKYSDFNKTFLADGDYEDESLDKVCDKIDKQLASAFKPTPVFWEDYEQTKTGIATSVNDNGEVFVSHPEKKGQWGGREKQAGPLFIDNAENRELYAQINAIRAELDGIAEGYRLKVAAIRQKMATIGGKQITKKEDRHV